jgi:tRNA uracil 4-sulfurtransferase
VSGAGLAGRRRAAPDGERMNVVVHYHEIALKGRNRPFFIERLVQNLRRATADLDGVVQKLPGRIHLAVPDQVPWEALRERIGWVYGVAAFGRAATSAPDLDALGDAVESALGGSRFGSFRVRARRSDKGFPHTSPEIERVIGARVQRFTGARVDLTRPELTLFVEVLRDRILFSFEKLAGPGGLPVGASGRVLTLVSGGIDSPVAAARLMRRGCTTTLVHFHAFPLLDRATIDKTRQIARVLARHQLSSRLLLVPFGPVQQAIVASCPEPLRVVLYRRFMLRIAQALARRCRARALVTGESLGQVASQTLGNMAVIDKAAEIPVLRPLVGMDKDEIVAEARQLRTFEISTLPDQDCCQLFMPRRPATCARLEEVERAESRLDAAGLVATALATTEEERFAFPEA